MLVTSIVFSFAALLLVYDNICYVNNSLKLGSPTCQPIRLLRYSELHSWSCVSSLSCSRLQTLRLRIFLPKFPNLQLFWVNFEFFLLKRVCVFIRFLVFFFTYLNREVSYYYSINKTTRKAEESIV